MKISSPIPHILAVLALKFKDDVDSQECIDMLEGIETTEVETNSRVLDATFDTFIKRLHSDQSIGYRVAAFASTYMNAVGHPELGEKFARLTTELFTEEKMSDFYGGYIAGIFSSCLMNDLGLSSIVYERKGLPKSVEDAVKYIESEGFSVYVK